MPSPMAGASPLDGPPPSPDVPGGGAGGSMPTGMSGLAAPAPVGSQNLPPEILTGLLSAAEKIDQMFDSFAQVTPDLAMDWDLCKEVLKRTLGKVLVAGGGATSQTNVGSQFPGGGTNAGMAAPGPS